jgi:hypothetical protein
MKHHALNPAPRHNNRSQQPPTATQQLTQFLPHLPQLPQFLCPLEEAELSVLSIIAFPNNMSYKQQPAYQVLGVIVYALPLILKKSSYPASKPLQLSPMHIYERR